MEIKTTDEICYYLNDDTMKDFKWISLDDLWIFFQKKGKWNLDKNQTFVIEFTEKEMKELFQMGA